METAVLDDAEEYDYEYFPLVKLVSSLMDVIWEQSEQTSTINTTPWNRLGAITKYCCSIYGLTCLIMALVLNRTLVMASTNNLQQQQFRRGREGNMTYLSKSTSTIFKTLSMISFRIGVIMLFAYQLYNILVVLNLHYHLGLTSTSSINWLYKLIPDSLFSYDVEIFNDTKYMKTPDAQVMIGPTSDMYWPIFLTFCLLSFIETFIASIQGKKPYTESGITIFEHSLAFQEFSSNGAFFFGSSKYYKRPTEQVLLTTLFLILNHLNIHIGAIINDNKYRLIPLTVLGMTFLGYFVSLFINSWDFLQFPFILILTFTPQVLILFIICVSLAIFLLAIMVNGFKLQGLNYASFFLHETVYEDGEEEEPNSIIKNLNIDLNDDFYTALLNIGVMAITLAGRSSYITELSLVTLEKDTWVERSIWERLKLSGSSTPATTDKSSVPGYGNIIKNPPQRLISGNQVGDLDNGYKDGRVSVFRRRFIYLKQMINYTCQLLYGLIFKSFVCEYLPTAFKRLVLRRELKSLEYVGDETNAEFEKRKSLVPPFLRKYLKRRVNATEQVQTAKETVNLDGLTADEIPDSYARLLLSSNDISEVDTSGDYQVVIEDELESEYESDAEEVFIDSQRGGHILGGSRYPYIQGVTLPIHELFHGEDLNEMFSATNSTYLDIFQKHMQYNKREGRLTRSVYRELQNSIPQSGASADDTEKLLELIVSKRMSSTVNEHTDDNERSLDCVICQTNPREIITWPCKCFAICEGCRLSLVSKGIEGCVCCRRDVEGVSKIFVP